MKREYLDWYKSRPVLKYPLIHTFLVTLLYSRGIPIRFLYERHPSSKQLEVDRTINSRYPGESPCSERAVPSPQNLPTVCLDLGFTQSSSVLVTSLPDIAISLFLEAVKWDSKTKIGANQL